jgi:hypothetical protein
VAAQLESWLRIGCFLAAVGTVTVHQKLVPGTVAKLFQPWLGAAGSIGQVGIVPMGPVLVGAPAKIIGDFSILGTARPASLRQIQS